MPFAVYKTYLLVSIKARKDKKKMWLNILSGFSFLLLFCFVSVFFSLAVVV